MKKHYYIASILVLLLSVAAIGAQLQSFRAYINGSWPVITWQMADERGVTRYAIERSMGNQDNFLEIATFNNLLGNGETYTYIDHDVLKASATTYYYRLRIDTSYGGNQSYSPVRSVEVNNNLVQQTWGSLKALFR